MDKEIIIENNFDFVDLCEKNIENYDKINKIKNIINNLNDVLNIEKDNNIKNIKSLNNKLDLTYKMLKKIENNLIK
jgi:flagellin-specific chaperone FliS